METDTKHSKEHHKPIEDEPVKIQFCCSCCQMSELVHYFGKFPPFTKNLELKEDSYVMKDPFSQPPTKLTQRSFTEYFIVLGTHCKLCDIVICRDCCIFYKCSFCYQCAGENIKDFPLEVQSKIRKELLAIKNR